MAYRPNTYQPLFDHMVANHGMVALSATNGQWDIEYTYHDPDGVVHEDHPHDQPITIHQHTTASLHEALLAVSHDAHV
jgi:hypothetical protein